MFENAIDILKKIEDIGFEAYIVGGYVRDKLMGISSNDIDITTNARPDHLINLFDNIKDNSYGSFKILYKGYEYEITTFRKDLSYKENRWPNIVYVNTLREDLLRRDFTINTLCLDKNAKLIDLYDGMNDINNKIIKCVKNPKVSINEDSLRILRAIRFASSLNFKIDNELKCAIREFGDLLYDLSYDRKKEELNKMFNSSNFNYLIDLIKDLNLHKKLEIKLKSDLIQTNNILGIWSQIEYSENYQFSNYEKKIINNVKQFLNKNIYNNYDLYILDIESINILSEILNNKIDIKKNYNNLSIHKRSDINITYNDLISKLNITNNEINNIYIDLEKEILYNNLKNEKDEIISYLITKYEMR